MNILLEGLLTGLALIAIGAVGGFMIGQQYEANKWRRALRPMRRKMRLTK